MSSPSRFFPSDFLLRKGTLRSYSCRDLLPFLSTAPCGVRSVTTSSHTRKPAFTAPTHTTPSQLRRQSSATSSGTPRQRDSLISLYRSLRIWTVLRTPNPHPQCCHQGGGVGAVKQFRHQRSVGAVEQSRHRTCKRREKTVKCKTNTSRKNGTRDSRSCSIIDRSTATVTSQCNEASLDSG